MTCQAWLKLKLTIATIAHACIQVKTRQSVTHDTAWRPYEQSPYNRHCSDLTRTFSQLRWACMQHSPLCWDVPQLGCTWGAVLMVAAINAQLAWVLATWLLHQQDHEHNLRITGALQHMHPACHL